MNRPDYGKNGEALFADVLRYDSFGLHRTGSKGAEDALDWIADELVCAGLDVSQQHFPVARQFRLDEGALRVGGHDIPVVPQWWLPENCAAFIRSGRIGDGAGEFHLLELPYDQGA